MFVHTYIYVIFKYILIYFGNIIISLHKGVLECMYSKITLAQFNKTVLRYSVKIYIIVTLLLIRLN